jgi:pyroglutamyl-peptidase
MRQQETILLTGFGPFPGFPDNASARLVPKLAHLAARRFSAHRVVGRVLPTEWDRAPARLEALYQRERPKLVLHFGVSERAHSFVIETVARNSRIAAADAKGALPSDDVVFKGGPETLRARLPAEDIAQRLAALNVPVIASDDAGSYLCNALLYRSLMLADETDVTESVGFLHIPPIIAPAALKTRGSPQEPRFDWATALAGGLEIIRTCLGRPPPSRRHVKVR